MEAIMLYSDGLRLTPEDFYKIEPICEYANTVELGNLDQMYSNYHNYLEYNMLTSIGRAYGEHVIKVKESSRNKVEL